MIRNEPRRKETDEVMEEAAIMHEGGNSGHRCHGHGKEQGKKMTMVICCHKADDGEAWGGAGMNENRALGFPVLHIMFILAFG